MNEGILVTTPDLRPSLYSMLMGLDEAGLLRKVVTTIALRRCRLLGRLRGYDRRVAPNFLEGKIVRLPWREAIRIIASRFGGAVFSHHVWKWAESGFDRAVARRFAGKYRVVLGMEYSSVHTFASQKAQGGLCILRQVNAHPATVAAVRTAETAQHPELVTAYDELVEREENEARRHRDLQYSLADMILCNSAFVLRSFVDAGIASEKLACVPTGCPAPSARTARAGKGAGPLRFLFAGTLSYRKGVAYLMEAWRSLGTGDQAELWLAGARSVPDRVIAAEGVRHFGVVSHAVLERLYEQTDVLVLPTLCEGRAHVVLEALAFGLPIITTDASGCEDVVIHERNGLIVPVADSRALADAMILCVKRRGELPGMGRISRESARSWTVKDANEAHVTVIGDFLDRAGV